MPTSALYPYLDYNIWIVYHKKENRRYAVLVNKINKKDRTTISYARYLLSVKIGRKLKNNEHADHIDNNKLNDNYDNLQILSQKNNREKYEKEVSRGSKFVLLQCPNCSKTFSRKYKNTHLSKHGIFTSCSRKCSGTIRQKLQMGCVFDFSKNVLKVFYKQ